MSLPGFCVTARHASHQYRIRSGQKEAHHNVLRVDRLLQPPEQLDSPAAELILHIRLRNYRGREIEKEVSMLVKLRSPMRERARAPSFRSRRHVHPSQYRPSVARARPCCAPAARPWRAPRLYGRARERCGSRAEQSAAVFFPTHSQPRS
jgi:hypothetical protein